MILVCPECTARFLLNNAALGPEGRQVRCSKCMHIWHQRPDAEPEASPRAAGEEPVVEVAQKEAGAEIQADEAEAVLAHSAPDMPVLDKSALPALRGEPALSLKYFAGAFLGCFLLVFVLLLGLRSSVMSAWQPSIGFYSMFSNVPVAGEGLVFESVRAVEHTTPDGKVLVIDGTLTNLSDQNIEIPPLKVFLLSGEDILMEKVLQSDKQHILEAGQSTPFQPRIVDPVSGSLSVRLSFGP